MLLLCLCDLKLFVVLFSGLMLALSSSRRSASSEKASMWSKTGRPFFPETPSVSTPPLKFVVRLLSLSLPPSSNNNVL